MLRVLFLVTILSQTSVGLLLLCQKPCRYGNQTFCGHIPCPLPSCDKPLVLTPGDCCQHCPDSVEARDIVPHPTTVCPVNCTAGGKHYCFPIPCPLPPCVDPVKGVGECCEHCPNACYNNTGASVLATVPAHVETKNVTARYCPQSCTIGNQTLCYMVPCPVPPCQDPAKHKPTDCCYYCPNGPNCKAPDGSLVKANHWKIVNGKNCTCEMYNMDTICS